MPCYVYIKPTTTTDLKKVSGIIVWWSGEISPPHLRWKCFLFRIDRIGREGGVESRRKYEKTNYIEKYQICHLLIHNLPGAWLRAERNYYLLMVMAWWFEGAIVLSRRKFNRINEIINKCWEEGCSPWLSSPTTSGTKTTTFSLPNSFMSKTAAMVKLVHHHHAGILSENWRI